ncbi:substrate-binding periplasmic protein [Chitinimonas sp.]|uniref:substrate-binding periplasmic protein n=1 Tax=Chitinimonas sp. TaxID=1934313 RepID=UPI002F929109
MRVLLILLFSTLLQGSTLAERLMLVTEEYPPYNMSNEKGEVVGVSTDIVRELMAAAHFDYEVAAFPWARAIQMASTQVNTCVFSMSRTPEREALYKWVGPLVANDWALFAKKPATHPSGLEQLQNARIGSYQGDAIVSWLQTRGYMVDVAPNDDVNPRKVLAGRIDFWATGKLIGQYRLKQQKLDQQLEPVLVFNHTEMYLACQKGMPDEHIALLNTQLQELIKRGVVKRIYASYGYTP